MDPIILNNEFFTSCARFNHPYSDMAKAVICQYASDKFSDDLYESLSFKEPAVVKQSVKKRRAEFLAGRVAAVAALKSMREITSDIPIGMHRNPVWPKGITGSITHNAGMALAVVANKTDIRFVGVDCEDIFSLNTVESVGNIILTDSEIEYLKKSGMASNLFCSLVFSAKESLFKAIYPYIHQYVEFDVANVFDICLMSKIFKIKLTKKITSEFDVGRCFSGYFEFRSDNIITIIICS